MIAPTGIIIIIIAVILMMLLRFADSLEEENRMLETSMESVRMYNEALEQRTEKIRRLRHDTLGLLQAIESAGEKSGEMKNRSAGQDQLSTLNMPLLDAIIKLKTEQCRKNRIKFDTEYKEEDAHIKKELPDETDICLLIQNMLDNAYEANLRISEKEKREIALRVGMDKDALTVLTSNSLPKDEKLNFSTKKANPELHGIGTKVIDEIIRKYEGTKAVIKDDKSHVLTIEATLKI